MKALLTFALIIASAAPALAQESVHPLVAAEFGRPIVVRAEFVTKSNTYYAKNVVSERFALKVLAVDDRELEKPMLMEYRLHEQKKIRGKIERPGSIQTFEAYESIYQPAMATPWLSEGMQGEAFALVHVLNLRLPQKKR